MRHFIKRITDRIRRKPLLVKPVVVPPKKFQKSRSLNTKINYMNEIEDTIKKAQDEALNKLRLGAVSGSHYPMLLMASYCGGENPKCTDELPCENCLKMSNIVLIPKDQVKSENIISGYDFLNNCR